MSLARDEAYSIPEACQRTKLGRSKLYEEIKAGRLKTVKIGKRRLVRPEALTAWLVAHEV